MTDVLYCAEQINIPASLPDILKQFSKAAIRAQPTEIYTWAADYFQGLVEGKPQEFNGPLPLQSTKRDLSTAVLKQFFNEMSKAGNDKVAVEDLSHWCTTQSIDANVVADILRLVPQTGGMVKWQHFLVMGCASVTPGLIDAVSTLSRVASSNGVSTPTSVVAEGYTLLCKLEGGHEGNLLLRLEQASRSGLVPIDTVRKLLEEANN
eukprot:m.35862 g.35862  ORF g.35862 m.35862 type:complete len:207 (-) comp11343_c0_seq1:173-793(-)